MRSSLNIVSKKNRIDRRLIVPIIVFSSLITLLITLVQLAFDYRQQRSSMNGELEKIQIYLPGITGSVWAFDDAQIILALAALARLPDVDQVAITSKDREVPWTAGSGSSKHVVTRTYPLLHAVRGKEVEIGTLKVATSLDAIYHRLAKRAFSILLGNALKTFFVVAFMVLLFRRRVTDRLKLLASDAGELATQMLPDTKVASGDRRPLPEHMDELDAVRWAFDGMAQQLRLAVDALRCSNEKLRKENEGRRHAQKALRDSESVLRQLAGHMEQVREDERKRIARDIHDDLGQNLMVLRIDVARIAARPDSVLLTGQRTAAALRQIDTAIKAVRSIINDLRPAVLDLGLHAALEWQATEFTKRTGIVCQLQIDHDEFVLDERCATALFRIVQEALSNVVRHAQASSVQIALRRTDGSLLLKIADDGIGLAVDGAKKSSAFGLVGIEERIDALGGTLSITSHPGHGMALLLSIPL